jgi:DNA-binding SARP family transcriptional activator
MPTHPTGSTYRFNLLGHPRFERADGPVDLSASKAIALLAYLAVDRVPHSRERLLALLWPDSSDEAARKNLRNILWTIRRVLGEDVLASGNDSLALSLGVWTDIQQLEQAAASRFPESLANRNGSLVRGPFLDGLTLTDAPDYEAWLTAERERLGQLYLRVLWDQAELHRSAGDWPKVAEVARRALQFDSLQEPAHRLLMEAHARLSQRAEALRQYESLRKTLAGELGVEPLAETEALHSAILNGAFDRHTGDATPASGLVRRPRRQPMLGDAPRAPFTGRAAELAALAQELAIAQHGRLRAVLLSGEVGIGKTRLWQEWSAALPVDTTVLEARCIAATQAMPFAPLIELLGNHSCLQRLTGPDSPVSPVWLAEMARVLPGIRAARPDLPAPQSLPLDEERHRLFEAFSQFLLALGARPLIFFVDDLHWVDRTTLDFVDYLAHRLHDQPLLLVATYRPEDAPAALVRVVAGWGREGILRRLPLDRLTDAEAVALIEALGGDARVAEHAQAQSAGNPYFLIELVRADGTDVPQALADLVRSRLDRLSDFARQVLQAAAVLGPDFDFATLRRTSGRGEEETLDALDELLNAAVLIERAGRYAFSHPLVGEVVRAGMSKARRAFLHRRAAEALEAAYAGRLPPVAAQLSQHYEAAGDPARAATYADMAARRALELAAPSEAAELRRRALALGPTPARRLEVGRALQRLGEVAEARSSFEVALSEFVAQADHASAARACLDLAGTYFPAGRFDEVLRWVEQGLGYLETAHDPASQALAHFLLGVSQSQSRGPTSEAEQHLAEAARLAVENAVPQIAVQGHFELGNLRAQRGDLPGALQAYGQAMERARVESDTLNMALAHNNYAYHAMLLGDLASAHEHIDSALALTESGVLRMPRQYTYSTRGEIALAERQWDEADAWFKRGMAEAERAGNRVQMANYRANQALAAQGRGDLDAALILLESAYESAANELASYLQIQIDLWLAGLHIQRGERAAAGEALRRAETRLDGRDYGRLRAWAARLRSESRM